MAGDVPLSLLEAFAKENLPRVEIIRPQEKIPDAVTVEDLEEESHEFMRGILYYAGIDPDEASELFTQDDVSMKQLKEASVTLNATLKSDWIQGADLRYELSHESAAKQILLRIEDPAVSSRLVRASRRSSGFTHFFALNTVLYARQKDYVANSYISCSTNQESTAPIRAARPPSGARCHRQAQPDHLQHALPLHAQ